MVSSKSMLACTEAGMWKRPRLRKNQSQPEFVFQNEYSPEDCLQQPCEIWIPSKLQSLGDTGCSGDAEQSMTSVLFAPAF